MKLTVRKVNHLMSYVNEILTSSTLTYEDRKNFRKAKEALSDSVHGTNAKLNNVSEIFTTMSQHKKYIEDADKLKELIKEKQVDMDLLVNESIDFKFTPFDFTPKFQGERADTLRLFTAELEDIILTIK